MKNKYILSFDSLRFLSMLAIIFYHYFEHRLVGGYLGVNVFFILSGFLVTRQMEKRLKQGQSLSVGPKLAHRFLKIFRPLLIFIVISLIFLFLFQDELLVNVRPSVLSSLAMVNNWQQIFSGQSYFEAALNPSIYTHLWYLSAYFQMNLIWTLAYPALRSLVKGQTNRLLYLILAMAGGSALLMAILYDPAADPSRVYYGTDTRFFSFLLGAASSLLADRLPVQDLIKKRLPWLAELVLALCLAAMVALAFKLDAQWTLTYRGGMVLFDLLASLAVLILALKQQGLSRLLTFKPMVWLGQQSLSLYLWYYPVYIICYSHAQGQNVFNRQAFLQIILIFVLAIFYQGFVINKQWRLAIQADQPVDHPLLRQLRDWPWSQLAKLALTAGAVWIVIQAPNSDQMDEIAAKNQGLLDQIEKRNQQIAQTQADLPAFEDYLENLEGERSLYYDHLTRPAAELAYQSSSSFLGDSIVVGASSAIYTLYPQATVAAQVGMQLKNAVPMVEELKAQDQLHDHVFVFLGSNGAFTEKQLDDLIASIGDRQIYLITSHVNQPWVPTANQLFADKANASPDDAIHLIDWAEYFHAHPDSSQWLADDQIHFQESGSSQWIGYISDRFYEINQ